MALSTPARLVLATGLCGLGLVVLNQLTAPSLEPPLERASVVGSILAVVLLLVAFAWQQVEAQERQRVALVGQEGFRYHPGLPEACSRELAWGSRMLLTATAAAVVLLHWRGQVLLHRGLLGEGESFTPGAICARACSSGKAISLVDLKLYPGRAEFSQLLQDLPSVVVQPLGNDGVLLVGGWAPRCFSRSDLCWIEGWAQRLRADWLDQPGPWAQALEPRANATP